MPRQHLEGCGLGTRLGHPVVAAVRSSIPVMRAMNSLSSNSDSDNSVPEDWGWRHFFMTMSTFLHSLEDQENASEGFCKYVVDRLELCIQSVAAIILSKVKTPHLKRLV